MEIYNTQLSGIVKEYAAIKNDLLFGRYITYKNIEPVLQQLESEFKINILGASNLGQPIPLVELGNGPIKILMWSQMHGNESTTTKAVFDLLNAFRAENGINVLDNILESCTIKLIPMLNPDGAAAYTRVNANNIDLNRDAKNLMEPESKLLKEVFEQFQPDFCFNLHDQRTIFSAGSTNNPATLSFLTPSSDPDRTITPQREVSMQIIASIAQDLKAYLPNNIGRYDDSFNINCTGDSFQSAGVPTILFEAGHFPGDYEREKTREFVFLALVSALKAISTNSYSKIAAQAYFELPENEKLFNDVILRSAKLNNFETDIAIQFKEEVKNGKVSFVPIIEKIAHKISNYGHREIECEGEKIEFLGKSEISENDVVDKIFLKNEILTL